jgi:hypothetical protein
MQITSDNKSSNQQDFEKIQNDNHADIDSRISLNKETLNKGKQRKNIFHY